MKRMALVVVAVIFLMPALILPVRADGPVDPCPGALCPGARVTGTGSSPWLDIYLRPTDKTPLFRVMSRTTLTVARPLAISEGKFCAIVGRWGLWVRITDIKRAP